MDNQDILQQIQALVAEEHELRGTLDDAGSGADAQAGPGGERRIRLRQVEEQLDQYWDLLRQRRAKAAANENPDTADLRPVNNVEGYRQ